MRITKIKLNEEHTLKLQVGDNRWSVSLPTFDYGRPFHEEASEIMVKEALSDAVNNYEKLVRLFRGNDDLVFDMNVRYQLSLYNYKTKQNDTLLFDITSCQDDYEIICKQVDELVENYPDFVNTKLLMLKSFIVNKLLESLSNYKHNNYYPYFSLCYEDSYIWLNNNLSFSRYEEDE